MLDFIYLFIYFQESYLLPYLRMTHMFIVDVVYVCPVYSMYCVYSVF